MPVSFEFAYTLGISHGWSAANFVDAYGGERQCPVEHSYGTSGGYESGWQEGWDRYRDDQWPDGTSRLDEHELA